MQRVFMLSRSSKCTRRRTPFQWWCRVQNKWWRKATWLQCRAFVQLNDNNGAVSVGVVTKVGNFNVAVDLDVWGAHREVGDGEGGLVAFFTGDRLFTTCECGSAGNQAEGEKNVFHGHDLEVRK